MAQDSEPPHERSEWTGTLDEIVRYRLGAPLPELLIDPQPQLAAGLLDAGEGLALAVATGEFLLFPRVGWEWAARLGFLAAISGAAASGLKPRCVTVSLHIPESAEEEDVVEFWRRIHREAGKHEVAVVANRVLVSSSAGVPHVGTCVAIALGPKNHAVSAATARDGDCVVMTNSAGFEAAALLAAARTGEIAESFGGGFAENAVEMRRRLPTVREAEIAGELGVGPEGVTAMHNVGAAGLLQALRTLALSSEKGVEVDLSHVLLCDEVDAILSHFQVNPLRAAGQGSLLICCRPAVAGNLLAAMEKEDIRAAVIGRVSSEFQGLRTLDAGQPVEVETGFDNRLSRLLAETSQEQAED